MKQGIKTIILGIILFTLGGIALPVAILLPLFLGDSTDKQFSIPGNIQVATEKPGRYYLWNDHQTIFNGTTYNRSEDLPDGIEISITNTATGTPFNFVDSASISISGGNSAKRSIGYIEVLTPARVQIEITGGGEERVFSFSRAVFFENLKRIFGGVALALIAGSSGVGLVIWGVVKSTRAKEKEGQDTPAVPDAPQQER